MPEFCPRRRGDFVPRYPLRALLGLIGAGLALQVMAAPDAANADVDASTTASQPIAATEPAVAATPVNSDLDAPLFYQLLVGEMELRSGQPGVAYQVLLDAARRTGDEALFSRVVNIALQARAGDQALQATKAWRDTLPQSVAAQQMNLQLVALLNRPAEAADPLRAWLALTPPDQRSSILLSLPRLFQRSPEPKKILAALNPVLDTAAKSAQTRLAARATQARLALAADEPAEALSRTQEIAAEFPQADEPMQLALELMGKLPAAEALVQARLAATPQNHALRLAYGQALVRAQRTVDATREFRTVTLAAPQISTAWFGLGALELDGHHPQAAENALTEYLDLLDKAPSPATEAQEQGQREARQQAWLMLAQAAEMRGDLQAAESWLKKIDSPERLTEARFRRASLLARQGKMAEARVLIQTLPEDTPELLRSKLLAESQLLRDQRDWQAAYTVLAQANERLPADADLLYEQAMMSEKLGRYDEMESLLRQVIAAKPDHFNAYNALGYSLAERKIRLEEARSLIAKALSFVPDEPFILDSMGWVEFRLGNKAEALRLLRQSYAARPDAEIAAHLGEVLWSNEQQDEARKVWQEGLQRDAKNESLQETLQRLKVKL
ncbi:tetratricopeptide repeat protein [Roseateles koreensis]|uniref:Tetratricopeptide repeat protein n=1 Tax=Roseateles koreensis TaxID=2987526 RepID=A0ABT5KSD2_9BURK|nr:tetratricopeptide repeat protein [Roseateles koreensis]MDC8785809.1 tetratricopeptide repeat protein [Roseateles koreensis]